MAKPVYKISRILLPGYQFEPVEDKFLTPREGWKLLIGRKGKKSEEATGYDDKLLVKNPRRNISQLHCELEYRNGRWFIYDFESANGTFYDGEQIKQSQRGGQITYRKLVRESTISLGCTDFVEGQIEDSFLFRYEEIIIKGERDRDQVAQDADAGALAENCSEKPEEELVEPDETETAEVPSVNEELGPRVSQDDLPEEDPIDFHEETSEPVVEEPEVVKDSRDKETAVEPIDASRPDDKTASREKLADESKEKVPESKFHEVQHGTGQSRKHKLKLTSRAQRLQQKKKISISVTSAEEEGSEDGLPLEKTDQAKEKPKMLESDYVKAKYKDNSKSKVSEVEESNEDRDKANSPSKLAERSKKSKEKPSSSATADSKRKEKKASKTVESESEESDIEEELAKSPPFKMQQTKVKDTPKSSVSLDTKLKKVSKRIPSNADSSNAEDTGKKVYKLKSQAVPTISVSEDRPMNQKKGQKTDSGRSDAEENDGEPKVMYSSKPSGHQDQESDNQSSKSKSKVSTSRHVEKSHSSKRNSRNDPSDNGSDSEEEVISPVKRKKTRIISSSDDEADFVPKKKAKAQSDSFSGKVAKASSSELKKSNKMKDDSDHEKLRKKKKKIRTNDSEDDFQETSKSTSRHTSSKKRSKRSSSSGTEDGDSDDRKKRTESKRRNLDENSRSRKNKCFEVVRNRNSSASSSSSGSGVRGVIEEDIYVPKSKKRDDTAAQLKPWELKKIVLEMLSREPVIPIQRAFETKRKGTTMLFEWSPAMISTLSDSERDKIADQCLPYIIENLNNNGEDRPLVKQAPRYTFYCDDTVIRTKKLRNYARIRSSKKKTSRMQQKTSESSSRASSTSDNIDDVHQSDTENSVASTVPAKGSRREQGDRDASYSSETYSGADDQRASFEFERELSNPPGPSNSLPKTVTVESDSEEDSGLVPYRAPRQYDGAIARPATNRKVQLINALPLTAPRKGSASRIRRQDNLENEPEPLTTAEIRKKKLQQIAQRAKEEKEEKERHQQLQQRDIDVATVHKNEAKVRVTTNTRQDRFLEDIRRGYN